MQVTIELPDDFVKRAERLSQNPFRRCWNWITRQSPDGAVARETIERLAKEMNVRAARHAEYSEYFLSLLSVRCTECELPSSHLPGASLGAHYCDSCGEDLFRDQYADLVKACRPDPKRIGTLAEKALFRDQPHAARSLRCPECKHPHAAFATEDGYVVDRYCEKCGAEMVANSELYTIPKSNNAASKAEELLQEPKE